jgi:hypothetical protein
MTVTAPAHLAAALAQAADKAARPRDLPAPERRRLRTFAFDPMSSRLSGRFLDVDVRFEELHPGPAGELLTVVDYDATRRRWYEAVDLNHPTVLAGGGLRPSESDPRTHQQVVYAVAMSVIERFERYLGRRFRWRRRNGPLLLLPHAFEGQNAFFDPDRQAVLFGYYPADEANPGQNLPEQLMFTCLSSDIVAHEVTHAIVHRLRRRFSEPTNADVLAWHEGFADLVALFNHFSFPAIVNEAIAQDHGDIQNASALLQLAKEFGQSTGRGGALRSAIAKGPDPADYLHADEPHARGACFVAGVFDAFVATYKERTADLLRVATGGTGVLPAGSLHPDLVRRLSDEAVATADRLLGMIVRAFDYMPVVDVTFGDVLRAVVTSDHRLFADDEGHLRSRLIEALRRRGIYPDMVASLAEDALHWPSPRLDLSLTDHGRGDPADVVDLPAIIQLATEDLDVRLPTPEAVSHSEAPALRWAARHAAVLGLDPAVGGIDLRGMHVTYRLGADRQPRPQVVLQFEQERPDLEDRAVRKALRPPLRAGTTIIARVDGAVKHVIAKPLALSAAGRAEAMALGGAARAQSLEYDELGVARLAAVRAYLDDVAGDNALAAWTGPAAGGLTFAGLHGLITRSGEG